MIIVLMALGTIAFVYFAMLFISADQNLTSALLTARLEIEEDKINSTQIEIDAIVEEISETGDMTDKKLVKKARELKKKQDEAQNLLHQYQAGKLGVIDLIPTAGYRFIQLRKWDNTNPTIKQLNEKCCQFKNKKEAINYSYYIMASLIGYVLFGTALGFLVSGVAMGAGAGSRGIIIGVVAAVVFMLMGYLPYDAVSSTVTKRQEEIESTFPQAVSKMALLTVAGIEVSTAWKLTASSGKGTLYEEMSRVILALSNNVPPVEAYSAFIARCNNKYTTKLATAIIQNLSKGNSEIVNLFKQLNDESWLEHKHNSKRMGEKISSKLMIPTMLMFAGILVMIIVPVMSGFNF